MDKRNKVIPTLSRISPVLFFIVILLNCILYPSYESFYLFIIYFIVSISNHTFKEISKIIYNLLNTKSLSVLGSGSRPPNANSCAFILDNSIATSYGMPSGHSQTAWTFATYFLLKIIKNWYNKYNNNKNITIIDYIWLVVSCILIFSSAIYISYSRVYIEGCHTLQQVIVGGFIGIVSGFLIYYCEKYAIDLLHKNY
jgi:membrane-associated phospholipid phosphatase